MQENADTTVIELQGTGKIMLLLAPGQVADHETDSGTIRVTIENSSFNQMSLSVAGLVKAESIRCEGDYEARINSSDQQKSPCPVFDLNNTSLAKCETKGPQFTRSHRRNNSAYLFVSGQCQASTDKSSCKENTETRSTEENIVESLTSDMDSLDVSTNKENVDKICTADDVDGQISRHEERKKMCNDFSDPMRRLGSEKSLQCHSLAETKVNISKGIQQNMTFLLDQIQVMPLCDHLYQNSVITLDVAEAVFDGIRHGRSTRDCIRGLLIHLSRVTVREDELRKSLADSDHSDIIPLLLRS